MYYACLIVTIRSQLHKTKRLNQSNKFSCAPEFPGEEGLAAAITEELEDMAEDNTSSRY